MRQREITQTKREGRVVVVELRAIDTRWWVGREITERGEGDTTVDGCSEGSEGHGQ